MINNRASSGNNIFCRTIILIKNNYRSAGKILIKIEKIMIIGPPKTINSLVIITDNIYISFITN